MFGIYDIWRKKNVLVYMKNISLVAQQQNLEHTDCISCRVLDAPPKGIS